MEIREYKVDEQDECRIQVHRGHSGSSTQLPGLSSSRIHAQRSEGKELIPQRTLGALRTTRTWHKHADT